MFYDRNNELKRLNQRYQQKKAQFIIVYGRRRVGKTELLIQFAKDKPHIYFLADLSSEKEQLASFSERIQLFAQDPAIINNPFSNWQALFSYLRNLSHNKQLIVIIDEYQYLQVNNKAISSIIQKAWDEGLKETQIFLILCGSYISFMENELLAYKSPLYGRRTGQFYIEPLKFFEAAQFFSKRNIIDQIQIYGVLGGAPAYLLQFDPRYSLTKNIEQNILQPDAFLYNEPLFLLMQELREPRNYFAILKAISFGANRINDIVQSSGLDRGMVVKYLETLQNLRIVKRELPVQEKKPEKSRKGIYIIQDHFFRFWFRFVFPNLGFIEENRHDYVLREKIIPQLNQYIGPIFENVCIEFLKAINLRGKIPFEIFKIGRYWEKRTEIDIIAYDQNKKNILIGECKWSNKKVGTDILENLIEKSKELNEIHEAQIYYALFSKSGFTKALKDQTGSHVLLFDLKDIEKASKDKLR